MPKTETRVVWPDTHVQAEHKKAVETALAITRDVRPDRVIVMGDFLDTYSLTHHPRRSPAVVRFEDEIDSGNGLLDRICKAAPNARKHYLQGNHEGWAASYEAENPNLEGTLDIPKRLRLRERGIEWVPLFKQNPFPDPSHHFRLGPVAYCHGVYEGAQAARQHATFYGPRVGAKHVVFGHTHGMDSYTSPAGYAARSCGFLGDERNIAFSYVKGRPTPAVPGFLIEEICGNAVTDTEVRIDYATGRAVFARRAYPRD